MAPPESNFAPNSSLTPPQQRVIDILADGGTTAEAAAAIGVHRNTVRNWRRCIPDFARELDLALREQALHWQQQAVTLAPHAIETLRTILHNEAAPLSQKLRAATIILKMATEPKTPRHTPYMHNPAQPRLHEIPPQNQQQPRELPAMQPQATEKHAQIAQAPFPQPAPTHSQPSRNSLCPCHSGRRFKRCCAGRLIQARAA